MESTNRLSKKTHSDSHIGRNPKGHSARRRQAKKTCQRSEFNVSGSFLTHRFEEKLCTPEQVGINVSATYRHLLKCAKRYADLLGVPLGHSRQKDHMKGIQTLFVDLKRILPLGHDLNFENSDKNVLNFVVYEQYEDGNGVLFFFPMKGIHTGLKGKIKDVVESFLAHFFTSNGFLDYMSDYFTCIIFDDYNLDYYEEVEIECNGGEHGDEDMPPIITQKEREYMENVKDAKLSKEEVIKLLKSNTLGKKHSKLIEMLRKGIEFISGNENLLGDYSYNPYESEYYDYPPIPVSSQIRFIYSLDGFDGQQIQEFMTSSLHEGQEPLDITKCLLLTPETDKPLQTSSYPTNFIQYAIKLTDVLTEYERGNTLKK